MATTRRSIVITVTKIGNETTEKAATVVAASDYKVIGT